MLAQKLFQWSCSHIAHTYMVISHSIWFVVHLKFGLVGGFNYIHTINGRRIHWNASLLIFFLICFYIYHYLFMWCVCCVCKWCRFAVWNRTVWSPKSKSKSIFGLFAHRSVRSFRIESTTNVNYLTISNGFCSFAHAVPLCALLFIYRFDIFIYLYCVDMSSHLISKR